MPLKNLAYPSVMEEAIS